jgi:hypothetical protein
VVFWLSTAVLQNFSNIKARRSNWLRRCPTCGATGQKSDALAEPAHAIAQQMKKAASLKHWVEHAVDELKAEPGF